MQCAYAPRACLLFSCPENLSSSRILQYITKQRSCGAEIFNQFWCGGSRQFLVCERSNINNKGMYYCTVRTQTVNRFLNGNHQYRDRAVPQWSNESSQESNKIVPTTVFMCFKLIRHCFLLLISFTVNLINSK